MSADDGHMTDVELVPDGSDQVVVAPPAARRLRRPARRHLAVTAVLVVVAGAGVLAEHRSEVAESALSRAVAVPTAAASLREPVRELWRASGRVVGGGDGVLLLAESRGTETVLSGRRGRSGEELWTRTMPPARVHCPRTLRSQDGALVLCELSERATDSWASGRLWVLDPVDGAVHAQRTLDDRLAGWDVLDGDLVLARQTGRQLRVWREGLRDATVRWATVLPMPDGVSAGQVELGVGDGLVALAGGMGAVLSEEGDVLGRWERGTRGAVTVRTDGEGFAVWTQEGEGRWYDRAGRAGVRLPGEPVDVVGAGGPGRPYVGDARAGTPDGLLLVRTRGGIAAVDTRDERLLWSRGASRTRQVVVVSGVVALASRGEVRLVHLPDGRPGWAAPRGAGTDTGTVLTDGLRLLVPGHEPELGRTVSVHTLADGRLEWTAGLPPGAAALEVGPDGVLLAPVAGGVVVVGP